MLPDGLLSQFTPPRCEVLVSAFCDGGTVNNASFSLLHEVGGARRPHPVGCLGAASPLGNLPTIQIWHSHPIQKRRFGSGIRLR